MTDDAAPTDRRTAIDRRLTAALDPEVVDAVPLIRETLDAADDRWYGELLLRVHDSLPDGNDRSAVTAAATIELLRGYCRLRSRLLVQLSDDVAHSLTADPTDVLLASDLLYSTAYSVFADVEDASPPVFEALTEIPQRVITAFATHYADGTNAVTARSLVDDTIGALGEGAAVLGATIADAPDAHRDAFATLGRGLGAAEGLRRTLDAEPGEVRVARPDIDETRLREHTERRREDAARALRDLGDAVDAHNLRPLVSTDT